MREINIEIPEIFEPLFTRGKYRYKVYHGGRASGKSHSFARALLALGASERLRILCAREIQKSIRDSVHKLLKDCIEDLGLTMYNVTREAIVNTANGTEFIFRGLKHNTLEIKSLESIDICWIEEGQSISNESLNILIPTIRNPNSEIWVSFNRFLEHDPVYDRFCIDPDEKTYVKQVSYRDNPYFNDTLDDERKRDYKRDPDEYLHIWEGEPLYQSEDSILNRTQVDEAMRRTIEPVGGYFGGIDVARYGKDRTEFYRRHGYKVIAEKELTKAGVDEVISEAALTFDNSDTILVDATGVGGGVSDGLRARGFNAIDVNFNQLPKDPDKYDTAISEIWFTFREIIDEVSIPFDTELYDELTNRRFKVDRKGRRCVESKDDYKKRGNRSPDKADALLLCFYDQVSHGTPAKITTSRVRPNISSATVTRRIRVREY